MKQCPGFTLIEIVFVVVLLGVISVVTTLGFSRTAEEYLLVKENTVLAQKAQVALNRIFIELMQGDNAGAGVVFEAAKLQFPSSASDTKSVVFKKVGTNLLYNDIVLCDNVNELNFDYAPSASAGSLAELQTIMVTLVLQSKGGVAEQFDYTMTIKKW